MIAHHVSELAIDKLLAGELSLREASIARDHAATCERCGALLEDAVTTADAFAAHPPRLALPRASSRNAAVAAGALAAGALAAAIAVLVVRTRPSDESGTRSKGGAILGFFVSHAGEARRGGTGELVQPGDQLQLYTTVATAGWLAVTSIDGAGVRSVYVAPRAITAGHEQLVPLSIVLDVTLGAETVTGIFCREPFTLDDVPTGCTTDQFVIHKVAR